MTRHVMEPDPKRKGPTVTQVLWIYALIFAFVVFLLIVARHHG